jgi:hypothetical protein
MRLLFSSQAFVSFWIMPWRLFADAVEAAGIALASQSASGILVGLSNP